MAFANHTHTPTQTHTHTQSQTAPCTVRPDFKKAWTLSSGGYVLAAHSSNALGLNFEATKAFNRIVIGVGYNKTQLMYNPKPNAFIGTGSRMYISTAHVPFQNTRIKVFHKASLGIAQNQNYQHLSYQEINYRYEKSLNGSWDLGVQHLLTKRGFYRPSIGASVGVYSNLKHLGYKESFEIYDCGTTLKFMPETNNQFVGFRAEITLGFVIMSKFVPGLNF